jgi:hypothetical protein
MSDGSTSKVSPPPDHLLARVNRQFEQIRHLEKYIVHIDDLIGCHTSGKLL